MEITVNVNKEKIKAQDYFKTIHKRWKYIAMHKGKVLKDEPETKMWILFENKPKYVKTKFGTYDWECEKGYHSEYLFINIDYDGEPEDSLFCRGDL